MVNKRAAMENRSCICTCFCWQGEHGVERTYIGAVGAPVARTVTYWNDIQSRLASSVCHRSYSSSFFGSSGVSISCRVQGSHTICHAATSDDRSRGRITKQLERATRKRTFPWVSTGGCSTIGGSVVRYPRLPVYNRRDKAVPIFS